MITEIIEYRLKVDADEDKFLEEARNYFDYFNRSFKGFIDLEFTKGDDKWINIMHWETMEDVRACGEALRNGPQETAAYIAFTERESVKLTFLEQKIFFK